MVVKNELGFQYQAFFFVELCLRFVAFVRLPRRDPISLPKKWGRVTSENKGRESRSALQNPRVPGLERCEIVATVIKSEFGLRRDLADTLSPSFQQSIASCSRDTSQEKREKERERERERERRVFHISHSYRRREFFSTCPLWFTKGRKNFKVSQPKNEKRADERSFSRSF